ncbi:MAG: peptide-methionine (S)-S-oxide reductase MsrA [Aquabacterium sp.]
MTHPAPQPPSAHIEEATFAGGCFWCIETVFNSLNGVIDAESGYSNGDHPSPTYEEVCSGQTGHAEVVRVRFDPSVISYRQLLEVFFAIHDPTTLNRQGNDVGTQYRSAIFTHNLEQAHAARALIEHLNVSKFFSSPVVTEVEAVRNYQPAEAYHQRYFEQNPGQGYCALVVAPKVAKFRKNFADLLKPR